MNVALTLASTTVNRRGTESCRVGLQLTVESLRLGRPKEQEAAAPRLLAASPSAGIGLLSQSRREAAALLLRVLVPLHAPEAEAHRRCSPADVTCLTQLPSRWEPSESFWGYYTIRDFIFNLIPRSWPQEERSWKMSSPEMVSCVCVLFVVFVVAGWKTTERLEILNLLLVVCFEVVVNAIKSSLRRCFLNTNSLLLKLVKIKTSLIVDDLLLKSGKLFWEPSKKRKTKKKSFTFAEMFTAVIV